MKLRLLMILAVMALISSCSKDDDEAPSVDNAKFSFAGNETIVTLPAGMEESLDSHASQVADATWELNFNVAFYTALMTPPSGAQKSTTEIVPGNGRVAATAGSVVVYTWGDEAQGLEVAYQVKDQSDSFLFELFMKVDGTWFKYFGASEKKDKSSGYMVMYTESSLEPTERWDWTKSGDNINFTFTDFSWQKFDMIINTKTKAGELKSYWGTTLNEQVTWELTSEITWNSDGSGTWIEYMDGDVYDQGTFEP